MPYFSNIWHKWLKHSAQEGTVREQLWTREFALTMMQHRCWTEITCTFQQAQTLCSLQFPAARPVWAAGIPKALATPAAQLPLKSSKLWSSDCQSLALSINRRSSLALTCFIEDYSAIPISNTSIDTTAYTWLCFSSQTVTWHTAWPDRYNLLSDEHLSHQPHHWVN